MQAVRRTWAARTLAEYRSSAITAELLHWLITVAVSPDTLDTCHRIVSDELAHADLSREAFLAAGGDASALPLPRESLFLRHAPDEVLELRCLAVAADVYCCGETVAVPLFIALGEKATEPTAVAALERILRDEAVHKAFGWQLLDELLERLGEPGRAWLAPRIPGYIQRIDKTYTAYGTDITPHGAAWGLMPPARFTEVARSCIAEVIRPRFEKRGLLAPLPT
jgi:hypothetical protein